MAFELASNQLQVHIIVTFLVGYTFFSQADFIFYRVAKTMIPCNLTTCANFGDILQVRSKFMTRAPILTFDLLETDRAIRLEQHRVPGINNPSIFVMG
jgi:hypothetical protein